MWLWSQYGPLHQWPCIINDYLGVPALSSLATPSLMHIQRGQKWFEAFEVSVFILSLIHFHFFLPACIRGFQSGFRAFSRVTTLLLLFSFFSDLTELPLVAVNGTTGYLKVRLNGWTSASQYHGHLHQSQRHASCMYELK